MPECMYRWWFSQTRSTSILFIKNLIYETFEMIRVLTSSLQSLDTTKDHTILKKYENNIYRCTEALKEALKGIEHLKITYSNDSSVVAQITVIISSANDQLRLLKKPKQSHKQVYEKTQSILKVLPKRTS